MNYEFENCFGKKSKPHGTEPIRELFAMGKEYDFSKSEKNPYAKHLKKQVTLRLGIDVIEYFKKLAEETGVPYQNLVKIRAQRTRLWFAP